MHYGHTWGFNPCCHGYSYPVSGGFGCRNTFVLIVVLFILLIIIGASYC